MLFTTRSAAAVLLAALLVPVPGAVAAGGQEAVAGLQPTITISGGSDSQRLTVRNAVDRYTSVGLPLPDLDVRLHDGPAGCAGFRGLFHMEGTEPVIDLCYDGEFLVLHELGHAWERFNLDAAARQRFERAVGAPSWAGEDTPHDRRAMEIVADSMAHGLLTTPLFLDQSRQRQLDRYELLTGSPSPRLAELDPPPAGEGRVGLAG